MLAAGQGVNKACNLVGTAFVALGGDSILLSSGEGMRVRLLSIKT